jgi:hypothetical protein
MHGKCMNGRVCTCVVLRVSSLCPQSIPLSALFFLACFALLPPVVLLRSTALDPAIALIPPPLPCIQKQTLRRTLHAAHAAYGG